MISNCTFTNNTSVKGGSIYSYFPGNLSIIDCNFSNNTASYGSSIYHEQECKIKKKYFS